MSSINGVPSTDQDHSHGARERRRPGRVEYENAHLIEMMRLRTAANDAQADAQAHIDEASARSLPPVASPQRLPPAFRAGTLLALTGACLVFWAGMALVFLVF